MKTRQNEDLLPRIESIQVENFRSIKSLNMENLTPVTVLIGPNGSGKSTFFDVFAFLSESFTVGLRNAVDKRGRFQELRSRGQTEPIRIVIKYREEEGQPVMRYELEIIEEQHNPIIQKEVLTRITEENEHPFEFLQFRFGKGKVFAGTTPTATEEKDIITEELASPDFLAVNALGQLSKHPRVGVLRRFITDWHLSHLKVDLKKMSQDPGPQEHLTQDGNNLSNVIQFLSERHPKVLEDILQTLCKRVPLIEKVLTNSTEDGRLLLKIKDSPFAQPILAKFVSDGTIKILAYLILLYDPSPPRLIGIEEPENYLHPMLLNELAEEFIKASHHSQLFITTHSPQFIDAFEPEQVWVIDRDKDGYSRLNRTSEMKGIKDQIANGAKLGDLWMEGFFSHGDPKFPVA